MINRTLYEHTYYTYIICNTRNTTFYIGVTNNLERRLLEHKTKVNRGFSSLYNLVKLVYYEEFSSPSEAIAREKQLKNWKRQWKLDLIRRQNPMLSDLSSGWFRRDSGSSPE